jgi:hypothetical protein
MPDYQQYSRSVFRDQKICFKLTPYFKRDLAWKEKYEQYFFDGDQQFYTKEFMIEHNML